MLLYVPVAWFWALPGILHTILHSTYYTLQYCKVSVREWAKNTLFSALKCLFMLGSLSSMERWSVTKHIQCFLLMSHDCLPTLFWIYKLKGQSCKHPLHYSLMPSFSSMPIFGGIKNTAGLTGCDQDCLVCSIWCSIGKAIRGASVLGFFCQLSVWPLWVLYMFSMTF